MPNVSETCGLPMIGADELKAAAAEVVAPNAEYLAPGVFERAGIDYQETERFAEEFAAGMRRRWEQVERHTDDALEELFTDSVLMAIECVLRAQAMAR